MGLRVPTGRGPRLGVRRHCWTRRPRRPPPRARPSVSVRARSCCWRRRRRRAQTGRQPPPAAGRPPRTPTRVCRARARAPRSQSRRVSVRVCGGYRKRVCACSRAALLLLRAFSVAATPFFCGSPHAFRSERARSVAASSCALAALLLHRVTASSRALAALLLQCVAASLRCCFIALLLHRARSLRCCFNALLLHCVTASSRTRSSSPSPIASPASPFAPLLLRRARAQCAVLRPFALLLWVRWSVRFVGLSVGLSVGLCVRVRVRSFVYAVDANDGAAQKRPLGALHPER